MGWIFAFLANTVGGVIKAIFVTKEAKLKIWQEAVIGLFIALRQAGITDIALAQAATQVIIAEATSDNWLTKTWRPIVAIAYATTFLIMLYLAYHGHKMPIMNETMLKMFDAVLYFVCGYGIARSGDKWVTQITKSKLVSGMLSKVGQELGVPVEEPSDESNVKDKEDS